MFINKSTLKYNSITFCKLCCLSPADSNLSLLRFADSTFPGNSLWSRGLESLRRLRGEQRDPNPRDDSITGKATSTYGPETKQCLVPGYRFGGATRHRVVIQVVIPQLHSVGMTTLWRAAVWFAYPILWHKAI